MPSTDQRRPVGRPKGEPSTIVNVRLPVKLLGQLDRYLDWLETHTGKQVNRSMLAHRALQEFLERHVAELI
jgi:hypothetical protein